ncbi:MAG: peptidyl-prolyl cis-trans isomerase [Candidatus Omnitrophota bacterium]
MSHTYKTVAITLMFLSILGLGCGNKAGAPGSADERVLARIGPFGLTVADFKEQANPFLINKYASLPAVKQKEQVLEELIMKEVFLQEAQKMNLDKEKSFMKEIEGYWEQALMKSLINRKLMEFSEGITVSQQEILEEYSLMKRNLLVEMVVFNDKPEADKLSQAQANFDEARQVLKGKILWESPADWYASSDLPQKISSVLFSLKPGQTSIPIEYNGNWIVVRLLEERVCNIGPLENLRPRIAQVISGRKKEALIEKWSLEIRKKTHVSIDKELLKEIRLK